MQRGPHLHDPAEILKDLQHVRYEKKEHIAYVTFDRPEVLNGLNGRMSLEMYSIWLDAKRDKDVWAVIITGTGRAFQVGRDMKELVAHQQREEIVPRDDPNNRFYHVEAFPKFAEFHKPVIAAIQGLVAGGGLYFVAESHIRVMAEDAYMTDGHANFGNLGAPQWLIRDFDWIPAIQMYMCYKRLTAQDCYRLGIVNEICPKEEVLEKATKYAKMMFDIAPSILQAGTTLANMVVWPNPALEQLGAALNIQVRDVDPLGAQMSRGFVDKKSTNRR
jgi:enoyl-CoA hydratase/carnithine racemase